MHVCMATHYASIIYILELKNSMVMLNKFALNPLLASYPPQRLLQGSNPCKSLLNNKHFVQGLSGMVLSFKPMESKVNLSMLALLNIIHLQEVLELGDSQYQSCAIGNELKSLRVFFEFFLSCFVALVLHHYQLATKCSQQCCNFTFIALFHFSIELVLSLRSGQQGQNAHNDLDPSWLL